MDCHERAWFDLYGKAKSVLRIERRIPGELTVHGIASFLKMRRQYHMDLSRDEVDLGFVVNLEAGYIYRADNPQRSADRSIALASNRTAYKSGRHEVFERE